VEEDGKVYLVNARDVQPQSRRLRGVATMKMTTTEIMALTRG